MRPSGLATVGRGRGAEGREGVVGLHVCQKPQAEQGREALNQALGPSGKAAFVHRLSAQWPTTALGTSICRSPHLTSFKEPAEIPVEGKSDFLFSFQMEWPIPQIKSSVFN